MYGTKLYNVNNLFFSYNRLFFSSYSTNIFFLWYECTDLLRSDEICFINVDPRS